MGYMIYSAKTMDALVNKMEKALARVPDNGTWEPLGAPFVEEGVWYQAIVYRSEVGK